MKTTGHHFYLQEILKKNGEAKFLRKYGDVDFGEIILKAGHHGSKTSSTEHFIDYLRPELAIISAGRNNLMGILVTK